MQNSSEKRLLTVKEAEQITGRRASTWRRDILLRRIPSVRIGRQVRIPVQVIEKLINEGWRDQISAEETKGRIA
jgi:hypothetical protein